MSEPVPRLSEHVAVACKDTLWTRKGPRDFLQPLTPVHPKIHTGGFPAFSDIAVTPSHLLNAKTRSETIFMVVASLRRIVTVLEVVPPCSALKIDPELLLGDPPAAQRGALAPLELVFPV
jgi:hypothetical protein